MVVVLEKGDGKERIFNLNDSVIKSVSFGSIAFLSLNTLTEWILHALRGFPSPCPIHIKVVSWGRAKLKYPHGAG